MAKWPEGKGTKKQKRTYAAYTFHDKLAGICAGHGGTLAGGQDADGPDNQSRVAEPAAQPNAAFVNVNGQRIRRIGKSIGVIRRNIRAVQAQIVNLTEGKRERERGRESESV